MADLTEWSSNANEVLHIRLKCPDQDALDGHVEFQPAFTYPIFGEEETIFGYKDLNIQLDFDANTLEPHLDVTWKQKFDAVGETGADEVEEIIRQSLPESRLSETASDSAWEPPGELLHQYEVNRRSFGIWSTNLNNKAAKELLRNMQILVLFFIEGGSLLELDDPDWTMERWTIFLIYAIDPSHSQPQKSTYTLAGYSTTYRLFFLDASSALFTSPSSLPDAIDTSLTSRLPCRQRISQFLILPPYQQSGHGSILYNTMVAHYLSTATVHEITVEDPNESFDDMRDVNDLVRLRSNNPKFASIALNASARLPVNRSSAFDPALLLSPELVKSLRRDTKLAPRQFSRLIEMQLLERIPARHRQVARITRKDKSSDENDRAYYFWRLYVKQRLYRHNVDQLAQLELEERVEKLDETCNAVERDYVRLLEMAERRAKNVGSRGTEKRIVADTAAAAAATATTAMEVDPVVPSRSKKRRIVEDDDEEEEDGDGGDDDAITTATAKSSNGTPITTNGNNSVKKKVKLDGGPAVVDLL